MTMIATECAVPLGIGAVGSSPHLTHFWVDGTVEGVFIAHRRIALKSAEDSPGCPRVGLDDGDMAISDIAVDFIARLDASLPA